jgi:hypothetical protein
MSRWSDKPEKGGNCLPMSENWIIQNLLHNPEHAAQ